MPAADRGWSPGSYIRQRARHSVAAEIQRKPGGDPTTTAARPTTLYLTYSISNQIADANNNNNNNNKLCGRPPKYALASYKLTYDLLTLKVVSESRVTWATYVPILVFLSLSVLELGPMYATDRQTSDKKHHLMPPPIRGGGITMHSKGRGLLRNGKGESWKRKTRLLPRAPWIRGVLVNTKYVGLHLWRHCFDFKQGIFPTFVHSLKMLSLMVPVRKFLSVS